MVRLTAGCIRQFCSRIILREFAYHQLCTPTLIISSLRGILPVSYTHLDVYKRQVYSKEILSQLENIIPRSLATEIQEALYKMDVDALQRGLEKYLMQTISFYDAANESYYHGMIVGLCAMMINSFRITSNRESGNGRYDVQMLPLTKHFPGFLIEIKAEKDCSEEQLEALAQTALQQINDRSYSAEMQALGIKSIIKYGLAFSGKSARIAAEKQTIA